MSQEIQTSLSKSPNDYTKFQRIFNLSADRLYQDILEFERENINKHESKVYKLKKIFEKRYRPYFLRGEFIKWSYKKPFGYSGDFKIIDDIYRNQPSTIGFDRLCDNYFQQLETVKSIRERKDDFKKILIDFLQKQKNKNVRIMNLASGPAREIKEMLETDSNGIFSDVTFDCYDFDDRALAYAKKLTNNVSKIGFFQKNAVRLALKKDIKSEIPYEYDVIYSAGLFDYFDERIATRLVANLKKLLKKTGIMLISNARDKYNNPSAIWMEWVTEWYLIYRTEREFEKIFSDAGFSLSNVKIIPQSSKVMQYCVAKNT